MIDAPARSTWTFHNTTATEPGWLSPSSIGEFLRCSYCWKLNRIDRLPRPLGINLPIGSAVHKALETARLSGMSGPSTLREANISYLSGLREANISYLSGLDAAVQAAADHFDVECAAPTDEETGTPLPLDAEIDLGSKYGSLGEAKDHAVALAKFAIPRLLELDAKRGKLAATEYNLSMLESPWPFAVQGRLDALYVDWLTEAKPEEATIMADLKTASKMAAPDEYVAIAQSIYEMFWHARGRSLVVLADVVSKAKHPDLQTFPLSTDDYGRKLVYQTVMEVAEDISAGRFRMRPNFTCPYLHGLPEFQIAVGEFPQAEAV